MFPDLEDNHSIVSAFSTCETLDLDLEDNERGGNITCREIYFQDSPRNTIPLRMEWTNRPQVIYGSGIDAIHNIAFMANDGRGRANFSLIHTSKLEIHGPIQGVTEDSQGWGY